MMKLDYELLCTLSARYGDSFYIVDTQKLKQDVINFRASFRALFSDVVIAYSFKTCFLKAVLDVVKQEGCWAEITSEYEYELARKMGFEASKTVYNGPYKSTNIMVELINQGGVVNLDSLYEVKQLCSVSELLVSNVAVGLRCNFNVDGRPSRFGIDCESDDLERAIKMLQKSNVSVHCLHCHIKAASFEAWKVKMTKLVLIINKMKNKNLLQDLKYIDIGGGYRYQESKKYADLIYEVFHENQMDKLTVILEPGAAVAEGSAVFASRIVNQNNVNGKKYVTMAGCTDDVSAIRKKPPSNVILYSNFAKKEGSVYVGGFTCMEDDIISQLPYDAQVGDFLLFENVGAYSSSLRSNFIRGYPAVLKYDGDLSLSRAIATPDYYFRSSGDF